jgi:hypothetical protein
MYEIRPNLVIGFHGCDKTTRESLLENNNSIEKSEKPHDWLGHGIYFWENNLQRAWDWAKDKESRGEIKEAAVVGAILHLGICCDFMDSQSINLLTAYYNLMKVNYEALGKPLPENKDARRDIYNDKLIRELDCAAIEFMHEQIFDTYQRQVAGNGYSNIKIFESTRGVFTEGGEAFPGSAIQKKNHVQICIRNLNCIKGFFLPRTEGDFIADLDSEYKHKRATSITVKK